MKKSGDIAPHAIGEAVKTASLTGRPSCDFTAT